MHLQSLKGQAGLTTYKHGQGPKFAYSVEETCWNPWTDTIILGSDKKTIIGDVTFYGQGPKCLLDSGYQAHSYKIHTPTKWSVGGRGCNIIVSGGPESYTKLRGPVVLLLNKDLN